MKPKFRNLISKALPVMLVLPGMIPMANAAAITSAGNGSIIVTSADNGANHIVLNGGVTPVAQINSGVILTADGVNDGIGIFSAGYSDLAFNPANPTAVSPFNGINNAGSITGGDDGLDANGFVITLYNSGTLAGPNTGVNDLGDGSVIANAGTINGDSGGIISSIADDVVVHNTGNINGDANLGSFGIGIELRDNAEIVNSGTILGGSGGITLGDDGTIINNRNGVITGNNSGSGNGIDFGNDTTAINSTVDISNYGSVTGNTGINAGSNVTIHNLTSFSPTVGGQIIGTSGNGITATTDLTVVNQASGLIRGSTNGIDAGDNASITNDGTIDGTASQGISVGNLATILNDGDITGGISGIIALDNANITNYQGATIDGGSNDGITAGNFTNIVNDGTITGGLHGVYLTDITSSTVTNMVNGLISGGFQGIRGDVGAETINNNGTITGVTNAIELNGGANIINLDNGSVVNGDVRATGGTNAITMSGGLTSTTDTTENTINGSVFNAITLNKTGSGLAVVTGTTAADTIAVTGGYLYLRNNVTNATGGENVITANSAEIGGLGVWDSAITLTNGASISGGSNPLELTNTVADSIGTLTVTGDVSLDSSSDYIWNVTPPGVTPMHDQIVLTGAGNVFTTTNSNFVIAPTEVNAPLVDGNRLVVLTDETLVGNFDNISVATFPSTTPDNGPYIANQNNPIIAEYFSTLTKVNADTDWQLSIVHDYGQFGDTPNEVAAGALLDGLVNTATGDVADLLAAMDYSDQSYTDAVLASLDPGSYMVTAAGLANNNFQLHRRVERHNAAVRAGGARGMEAAATTTTYSDSSAKGGVATTTTTTSSSAMDSGCSGATNVWGSFSYDWQEMHSSNSAFDQDGETASFTAGMDFTVAENFRLGVLGEGAQTDWSGEDAFGADVDSYRFAVYANWGAATGWFVDALVGYNMHDVDQSRSASDSARFESNGWQGLINLGYAIDTGSGSFSPFIGLEWQEMSVDEFESDGPLPLSVDGYDIESMRALAGVRWEGKFSSSMSAYASAAYAFELEDDAASTTVGFGGGSYTAEGLEQGDAVLVSAGLRWTMGSCTTIDIGYSGEFAMDDGVDSNGANIGVNFSF